MIVLCSKGCGTQIERQRGVGTCFDCKRRINNDLNRLRKRAKKNTKKETETVDEWMRRVGKPVDHA